MIQQSIQESISVCIERIKNLRGWNLAQIADQVGMNYEPFRNLVRGNVKKPPFDVILILHQLAGLSLDEHFGLSSPGQSSQKDLGVSLSRLEAKVRDLELEKHLLLDWIRKYAMHDQDPDSTLSIRFVNPVDSHGAESVNHTGLPLGTDTKKN